MKYMTGLDLIDPMTGGKGIDCLGNSMDDINTLDLCRSCDILHNEI